MHFTKFYNDSVAHGLDAILAHDLCFLTLEYNSDDIDDEIYNKIILMHDAHVPNDIIYTVVHNSLDWHKRMDVSAFWRELGAWRNKIGWTREQIAHDIAKYNKNLQTRGAAEMSVNDAIRLLDGKFSHDFIMHIFEYTVNPNTPIDAMTVNAAAIDAVIWMQQDGWSETDISNALKSMVDGKPHLDLKRLARNIPNLLSIQTKKISGRDGTLKIKSSIDFLKYVNPVLKFFNDNFVQIQQLSKKYPDSDFDFAQAFYKLYVHERGWDAIAPRFIYNPTEDRKIGGFSPLGEIRLCKIDNRTEIVNAIVHELAHFEQYLMLVHTPDIGVTPFIKEAILQGVLTETGLYLDETQDRFVADSELYDEMDFPTKQILFKAGEKRYKNEFYYNVLKFPYKTITRDMPEYRTVSRLANDFIVAFNHNNRGNMRFVYSKLLSEQIAYTVGNAAGLLFDKIEKNANTLDRKALDKIVAKSIRTDTEHLL